MRREKTTEFPPIEMMVLEEPVPTTELGNRACPFCGGLKLSRMTSRKDERLSWTICEICGATGPNQVGSGFEWNTRVEEGQISGPKETMMAFFRDIQVAGAPTGTGKEPAAK